jgi:hypothetical protein
MDPNFRNLTKFDSQFLHFYTILYQFYKFSLETKLRNHSRKEKRPATTTLAQRSMQPKAGPNVAQGQEAHA